MEQQINQLLQTFLWLVITSLAGFLTHKVWPMLTNKLKSQHNAKIIQAEDMALNFAKNIVAPLAVDATLGNATKRKMAVQKLVAKLYSVGIELPEASVLAIVERAYQLYKANGGDIHKLDTTGQSNSNQQVVRVTTDDSNNQGQNSNVQGAPANPYEHQGSEK
ncbi:phage holin, LLH family [Apilactobacillus micheneri]|uniref:phage holin, LLH family n=1 Tax=Apilactobacillus micheneri TaxID=1899430 RepID=UPI0013001345|nr:phage holin, LLH family [Apilactobacillus micheneri]